MRVAALLVIEWNVPWSCKKSKFQPHLTCWDFKLVLHSQSFTNNFPLFCSGLLFPSVGCQVYTSFFQAPKQQNEGICKTSDTLTEKGGMGRLLAICLRRNDHTIFPYRDTVKLKSSHILRKEFQVVLNTTPAPESPCQLLWIYHCIVLFCLSPVAM